jgi:hypothetical protein
VKRYGRCKEKHLRLPEELGDMVQARELHSTRSEPPADAGRVQTRNARGDMRTLHHGKGRGDCRDETPSDVDTGKRSLARRAQSLAEQDERSAGHRDEVEAPKDDRHRIGCHRQGDNGEDHGRGECSERQEAAKPNRDREQGHDGRDATDRHHRIIRA